MKKLFVLFSFCCCIAVSVNASVANLYFVAESDMKVSIYCEIDKGYNNDIVQTEASLKADTPKTIIIGIPDKSDWEIVHCEFSNGKDCELLIFPQDEVTVFVGKKGISFEGSNAAGLQYFYDQITSVGHRAKFLGTVDKYFLEYVQQERGIHAIVPEISRIIITPQMNKLDSLLQAQEVTPLFHKKLRKNTEMLFNSYITERMVSLLRRPRYREVALKDSATIVHIADSIFQKYPVNDPDLIKFNYYIFYIPQYLSFYYGEQQPDLQGYDLKAFGPYVNYLHAPQFMQAALLGSACMFQLTHNGKEMDMPTLKRFFNEHFPDSPYVFPLNEQVKDSDATKEATENEVEIVYLQSSPATLSELSQTPECKGKYVLVDLWATWCAPCKLEFRHKDGLHALLSSFSNAILVYLSINRPEATASWKETIEHYQLGGLHLRASDVLTKDIRNKIYDGKTISVPRYFLLSPEGKIVNDNLPRPSNMVLLKETLEKIFADIQ